MLSLAVAQQCVSRPRATSMCPLLPGRQIHLGANFAWRQICLGGKSQCVSCQQLEAASGSLRRLFLKSELVKDLHSVLSPHDVLTMNPVFYKDKSWFETNFILESHNRILCNPIPNQLNIQIPHILTLRLAQMIQYCDHGSSVGVLCVRS